VVDKNIILSGAGVCNDKPRGFGMPTKALTMLRSIFYLKISGMPKHCQSLLWPAKALPKPSLACQSIANAFSGLPKHCQRLLLPVKAFSGLSNYFQIDDPTRHIKIVLCQDSYARYFCIVQNSLPDACVVLFHEPRLDVKRCVSHHARKNSRRFL
jgi:hypothetical protein